MNNIKFSILIPTKDRLHLLKCAVNSIVNQSYSNWELVICDNNSVEDVESYISSLNEPRIIYYRQSLSVNVTDNWNTANDLATGEYIIMLGDDDALMPDALEKLCKVISENKPDIISFMAYLYLQPDVDPLKPDGDVTLAVPLPLPNYAASADIPLEWRRNIVDRCFNFELSIGYNMQYYCYSQRMIEKVRQYGNFYEPPYPDYYTTCMCLHLADRYVYIPEVLTVIGITASSYGYYYRNNIEKEGMKFHNEENYRLDAPEFVRNKLCSVDEMDTAALVTFASIEEKTHLSSVNIFQYYKAVIRKELSYRSADEIILLIQDEMSNNISNDDVHILTNYVKEYQGKKQYVPSNMGQNQLSFKTMGDLFENLGLISEKIREKNDIAFQDIKVWYENQVKETLLCNLNGRKVRIWGAYPRGVYLYTLLSENGYDVCGFIDKKKCQGLDILSFDEALISHPKEYILIPMTHVYLEIIEILDKCNYLEKKDYLYFNVN